MTNGTSDDLSQMAHTLEKSGDYRVLRRLVPRDVITPVPADQQIKVGSLFDVETTGLRIGQKAIGGPWSADAGGPGAKGGVKPAADGRFHRFMRLSALRCLLEPAALAAAASARQRDRTSRPPRMPLAPSVRRCFTCA